MALRGVRTDVTKYRGSLRGFVGRRVMPSFLSRLRRVLGWRPRTAAAPLRPVDHPLGLAEDGQDMAALDLFEGGTRRVLGRETGGAGDVSASISSRGRCRSRG